MSPPILRGVLLIVPTHRRPGLWLGVLIVCFGTFRTSGGQSFRSYTYGELGGLPSTWVFDITQGPQGRIWLATRAGLASFDGSSWQVLGPNEGFPIDSVALVTRGPRGRIYAVGETGGRGMVIIKNGEVQSVTPAIRAPTKCQPIGLYPEEECEGALYLATSHSLHRWDGFEWKRIPLGTNPTITSMTPWRGGALVASASGLFEVHGSRVKRIPTPRRVHGVGMTRDPGRAWLLGTDWIGQLVGEKVVIHLENSHTLQPSSRLRVSVVDDGFGGMFGGNDLKLLHYDVSTGGVRRFEETAGHAAGGASSLFRDRDGNVWISSFRGVTRIPSLRFANYRRAHGLQNNEVSAIAQLSSGQFVMGHANGLTIMEDSEVIRRTSYIPRGMEAHGDIKTLEILVDQSDLVWLAAAQQGLGKMSPDQAVQWYQAPDGFPVHGVCQDDEGNIWVLTSQSLFLFDTDHYVQPRISLPIPGTARRILRGRRGELQVLYSGQGLVVGHPGAWRVIKHPSDRAANDLYATLVDTASQHCWVGTLAGLFEISGDRLQRCEAPKIDGPVYSLVFDSHGDLWCGTHRGVVHWDGVRTRRYTMLQGLSGQEANRGAAICDQKGRLWFGTDRGVSCYRPNYDDEGSPPPIVDITELKVEGKSRNFRHPLTLDLGQRDLVFRVHALSFIDDAVTRFRCRLVGYDDDWWDPGTNTDGTLRYTNVRRGDYHLEVQARNSRGVWSQPIGSATIRVKGPLWESPFIIALTALFLAALGFGASRYVHKKRETAQLQELVDQRTSDLKTATQRYRDLFEKNRAAQLFIHADSGLIHDANPAAAALFGLPVAELRECSLSQLSGLSLEGVLEEMRKAKEGESVQSITSIRIGKQRRDAEIHSCLYDADMNLIQATIHDITERHRLEVELHMARRLEAIGRLAGGVAHDFNNLLTAIIGHAEGGAEDPQKDREAILGLAQRGSSLVQQLLTFGRRQEIRPETIAINKLVSATIEVLGRVLPDSVRIRSSLDFNAGFVRCDWAQMELVLLNLAVNARDAMPTGGDLEIKTGSYEESPDTPRVRIEVTDSGHGMSAKTLEKVFEPFFTTKGAGKGTGLGLSTAYGIIQQNGGFVSVKSSLGHGTQVVIDLPRVDPPSQTPVAEKKAPPPECRATILVVEDDPAVRPMVSRMLRRRGFEVVEAEDGAQALETCLNSEESVHLVLSDITMPTMDGPELALHLRKWRPDLKVLFMSGNRGEDRPGMEWAAFIPKPFSSEELCDKIHEVLGLEEAAS